MRLGFPTVARSARIFVWWRVAFWLDARSRVMAGVETTKGVGPMGLLRDALLTAGVSPRDIADAVDEARQVVRTTRSGTAFLARAFVAVGTHSKSEHVRKIALRSAMVAAKVSRGAASMLTPGLKRDDDE